MDEVALRADIWDCLRSSFNEIAQGEMSPYQIKQLLTDNTDQILSLFKEQNKAARIEERVSLAKKPLNALPSIFLNDKDVQAALKADK